MNKHPRGQALVLALRGWLRELRPAGGTQILSALQFALRQPPDPERHRRVVVLTDGAIQDERAALELLAADAGEGRLFVIGLGDDVKRDTVTRLAEKGRGSAVFADDPGEIEGVIASLFESVSAPLVRDLALEADGVEIEAMQPERLPDLYSGRPVTVRARVKGDAPTELRLHGNTMTGTRTFRATVTRPETRTGR